ncbi:hypothetical protein RSAG8_06382, partial [Rhizoctonia solani AG-8 WAC10335]
MNSRLKRPHVSIDDEESSSINVQVDLHEWDEQPTIAPKRGRGRPKIAKSLEFEVSRPGPSNYNASTSRLRPNAPPAANQSAIPHKDNVSDGPHLPEENDMGMFTPDAERINEKRKRKPNKTPNDNLQEWLDKL